MQFYSGPDDADAAKASTSDKKKKADKPKPVDDTVQKAAVPSAENDSPAVAGDSSGAEAGGTDQGKSPQTPELASQSEPATQPEPAPPTADHDGSESSQASDKPAS